MKKIGHIAAIILLSLSSCGNDHDEEKPIGTVGFKVLEYCPAPGQFINEGQLCQNQEQAIAYAEACFEKKTFVSLGAFGGYITVRMPKVVNNRKGFDFGIIGNPFSGSSEPGIVWVSEDTNNNGIADDAWYELKGSDATERNYEVTYYRPQTMDDIIWKDNKGNEGVIKYLPGYHKQMYYPHWIQTDSYTLTGSMLAHRTVFEDNEWKNKDFGYGFADNWGSDIATNKNGNYLYNQFDIDNAVDSNGAPVSLKQIHFVKIQSAVLNSVDVIGEVSTEIMGFKIF